MIERSKVCGHVWCFEIPVRGSVKVPCWVITTIQLDRAALLLYDIIISYHPVITNLLSCCGATQSCL